MTGRAGPRPDRLPRERRVRRPEPARARRARRASSSSASSPRRRARPDVGSELTPTPDRTTAADALGIRADPDPGAPARPRRRSPRSSRSARSCSSWPTTARSCRPRSSTCRTARSTSIRRCCRATAAPRRSRPRSWPATRDRRDAHAHGRGPRHRADRGPGPLRRSTATETAPDAGGRALARSPRTCSTRSLGPWLVASSRPTPQPAERRDADPAAPPRGRPPRPDAAGRGARAQVRAYQPWPGTFVETARSGA